MKQIGTSYVFGAVPDLKLVLPPGTLKYKIKERSGEFARIFLKSKNGISVHYLEIVGGELHPGISIGSNLRGER
jgi:hypothetical protein